MGSDDECDQQVPIMTAEGIVQDTFGLLGAITDIPEKAGDMPSEKKLSGRGPRGPYRKKTQEKLTRNQHRKLRRQ